MDFHGARTIDSHWVHGPNGSHGAKAMAPNGLHMAHGFFGPGSLGSMGPVGRLREMGASIIWSNQAPTVAPSDISAAVATQHDALSTQTLRNLRGNVANRCKTRGSIISFQH